MAEGYNFVVLIYLIRLWMSITVNCFCLLILFSWFHMKKNLRLTEVGEDVNVHMSTKGGRCAALLLSKIL
jgi:hypothetical protein